MATTSSRRMVKKKTDVSLPDDILIDILSRFPAKFVLRCRLVCKGWRDLFSTHDFIELHSRRSFPMILVSKYTKHGYQNVFLDKWWEPARKRLVFSRLDLGSTYPWLWSPEEYRALFSHGGLIVFQKGYWRPDFLICNPTRKETVTLRTKSSPKELWYGHICGVFFHPLLKEYCTLWELNFGGKLYYKMLNLGSKPRWRDIGYPWSHRFNRVGRLSPVLIGDHIYWLVMRKEEYLFDARANIMAFDIRTEKFVLMHCPIPSDFDLDCVGCRSNLSDIGGVLSFVLISRKREGKDKLIQVDIWKLKDSTKQLWVSTNPSTIKVEDFPDDLLCNGSAIVGEMLVVYSDGSFHLWNHKLGTTRTVVKNYKHEATFCHVMTLASLKNCKSKICI